MFVRAACAVSGDQSLSYSRAFSLSSTMVSSTTCPPRETVSLFTVITAMQNGQAFVTSSLTAPSRMFPSSRNEGASSSIPGYNLGTGVPSARLVLLAPEWAPTADGARKIFGLVMDHDQRVLDAARAVAFLRAVEAGLGRESG